jgi:hypothetical protein
LTVHSYSWNSSKTSKFLNKLKGLAFPPECKESKSLLYSEEPPRKRIKSAHISRFDTVVALPCHLPEKKPKRKSGKGTHESKTKGRKQKNPPEQKQKEQKEEDISQQSKSYTGPDVEVRKINTEERLYMSSIKCYPSQK